MYTTVTNLTNSSQHIFKPFCSPKVYPHTCISKRSVPRVPFIHSYCVCLKLAINFPAIVSKVPLTKVWRTAYRIKKATGSYTPEMDHSLRYDSSSDSHSLADQEKSACSTCTWASSQKPCQHSFRIGQI